MRCDEGQWSLPYDNGQGRINTIIIFTQRRKQIEGVICDNYKKGVERMSKDH